MYYDLIKDIRDAKININDQKLAGQWKDEIHKNIKKNIEIVSFDKVLN